MKPVEYRAVTQPADRQQKLWAALAAIPFLLSIALLGFALNRQVLLAFAIGWPIIQVIGYTGSLQRAGGDFTHPLFKTQVVMNYIALTLLVAIIIRAT